MNLQNAVYTEPCATLTYSQPLYIQTQAYREPEEYNGPFSAEPCETLAYSEPQAYSGLCRIFITENFVQNHM